MGKRLLKGMRYAVLSVLLLGSIALPVYASLLPTPKVEEVLHKPITVIYEIKTKPITSEDRMKAFFLLDLKVYAPDNSDAVNKVITDTVIEQCKLYKHDPLKLFSIIISESGGKVDAKHSNRNVVGICGINSKVWLVELKENGIVNSMQELKSPRGNIKAMAYIYNQMMNSNGNRFASAVHSYKGKVPETMYQVRLTMNVYQGVKHKFSDFKYKV
jgi:hypothetical protein